MQTHNPHFAANYYSCFLSYVVWALIWVTPFTAAASVPHIVQEVEVQGQRRVEERTILADLEVEVGKSLAPETITRDLRRIWSLGFFRDVRIEKEIRENGLVIVVHVVEKPAIRKVEYIGNDKLSTEDIEEVVNVKALRILNRKKLQANVSKIQELYSDKGYYLADVQYRTQVVDESPHLVDVFFDIQEKYKVQVRTIDLVGNSALEEHELKAIMRTREGNELSFLSNQGTFKEEFFQADLMMLQAYYLDHGYLTVNVGRPAVTISADQKHIDISVPIEEGEQYRIGKIDFSGDFEIKDETRGDITRDKLLERLSIESGDIFSRKTLLESIERIANSYKNLGYAYANVTPNTRTDPEAQTVELVMDVQPGKLVYFGRIDVVGNTKTRDKVIRRELRIYEGELYSEALMQVSKARIFQLGFFETVELTTATTEVGDVVDVKVEIKEKSTGTFQVGAGFSSAESFIANAQISQNNFLGTGQTLSLSAQLSFGEFGRKLATVQFYEPYFLDSFLSLGLNAYITQQYYIDFQRDATGFSPSLGYPITPDLRVQVGYTLEKIRISTDDRSGFSRAPQAALFNLNRDGLSSALSGTLSYDTRNNRLFPSGGQYHRFNVEWSDGILGSDAGMEFTKMNLTARYYHNLFWSLVFKFNASLGYVFGPNGSAAPISERFFPGGIFSVRGFRPRELGPTVAVLDKEDPASAAFFFNEGGNKEAVFNLELEFDILATAGIKGVLFLDAGNAYNDDESFFYLTGNKTAPDVYLTGSNRRIKPPLGLYYGAGFGLRWFSPIGPLRFEWGIPITKKNVDGESVVFEFTIGNFF
ncbi:MAG: outer membrane protein assembly factor BamA [Myxococcota bacterium]|nr:outer membrane protein assembly factor BamA [Myxococcota bacterium]